MRGNGSALACLVDAATHCTRGRVSGMLSAQFSGEQPMNPLRVVRAGTGIGTFDDWPLDYPPGEDRAARLEARDFGFNSNLAKIGRRANRAADVSARKHDHASRVRSPLSGVRHDPPSFPPSAERSAGSGVPGLEQKCMPVAKRQLGRLKFARLISVSTARYER